MVSSRLLFGGYGDGPYSRALHAGLLGNDALVVFDECHLVPAFATLLDNIEHAGGKLKPFHVMLMSDVCNWRRLRHFDERKRFEHRAAKESPPGYQEGATH